MHSDMGNSDSCQPQDLQDVGFGAQRNTNLDLERPSANTEVRETLLAQWALKSISSLRNIP